MARRPRQPQPSLVADTPPAESPVSTESRGLRSAPEVAAERPGQTLVGSPEDTRAVFITAPASARQAFYEALILELKTKYKIAIRKWRTHLSGVAYELKYRDGRIKRLITAPRPRSPVSAAIFLHEVGHHAIGFHRYHPRSLEEYYVWQWTFREMTARSIPIDLRVLRHYRRSMFHYVRGVKPRDLPRELHAFAHWPG